jgi:hypothetical protein
MTARERKAKHCTAQAFANFVVRTWCASSVDLLTNARFTSAHQLCCVPAAKSMWPTIFTTAWPDAT